MQQLFVLRQPAAPGVTFVVEAESAALTMGEFAALLHVLQPVLRHEGRHGGTQHLTQLHNRLRLGLELFLGVAALLADTVDFRVAVVLDAPFPEFQRRRWGILSQR